MLPLRAHSDSGRRTLGIGSAIALLLAVALSVLSGPPVDASTAGLISPRTTQCSGPNDFGAQYLGSAWPGGFTGVPVYSNGSATYVSNCYNYATTPSGKSVQSGMEWQCVELVNRLYITKGWISSTWYGDGDQLYGNAPSVGLTNEQKQGSITYLAPGDVISFNGPISGGHAAVVSQVSGSAITLVNQNTGTSSTLSTGTLSNGSLIMNGWAGYTPIGVVHAPSSAPTITTTSLPTVMAGAPYSAGLSATGGMTPYTWSASGALPPGLSLAGDGVISGVPSSNGGYQFTVKVTGANGASSSQGMTIWVNPGGNLLSNGSWGTGQWGPWQTIPVSGGTMNWTPYRNAGVAEQGAWYGASNTSTAGGSIYQDVPVATAPGQSYTFSIWIRSSVRAPVSGAVVLWGIGGTEESAQTSFTVGSAWQLVSVPLDVAQPGHTVLRAQVYEGTAGRTYYFDGGTLSAGPVTPQYLAVRSMSPSRVKKGTSRRTVTVKGADFYTGAKLTDSDRKIKFTSVVVISPTKIRAKVTVPRNARYGWTTVTVSEPGASPSACRCLRVIR